MHTSTITVSVMPDPKPGLFSVNPVDLEWSTTRGSGAGGQNRNKVETVAVVKHKPTGLTVRSESERSQYRNKQLALQLLTLRLKESHDRSVAGDIAKTRKDQIGTGMRGDKRRTVRVKDGTVEDHITGKVWRYKDYVKGEW